MCLIFGMWASSDDLVKRSRRCCVTRLSLLDHLISPQQQRRRDREAERLGSFEIDYELELRRLLDRQVGWLGAFEDSVDVSRRLPELTREARPERQQTAGVRIFPPLEDCRQPV